MTPNILALVARLVLAAVFVTAGLAKLADPPGTGEAALGFGVPEALVPYLARLLPLAELVVAGLLLPGVTAVSGAVAALVLLAAFSAAIAGSLAGGRAPQCHCFGQLHSAPIGPKTLVRNGVLAALAIVAVLPRHQLSAVDWIGRLDAVGTVALVGGLAVLLLLCAGTLAFVSLLRSYGKALVRLERVERLLDSHGIVDSGNEVALRSGLPPGTAIPALDRLAGVLSAGQPAMLLFMSPHCGPCRSLLPSVATWQREHSGTLTFAVAIDGGREEIVSLREELGIELVIEDDGLALYNMFRATGTPSAVLLAGDGTVASWVASGTDEIEELVGQAVSRRSRSRHRRDRPGVAARRYRRPVRCPRRSARWTDGARVLEPELWLLPRHARRTVGAGAFIGQRERGVAHPVVGRSRRHPSRGVPFGGARPRVSRRERLRGRGYAHGRTARRRRPRCVAGCCRRWRSTRVGDRRTRTGGERHRRRGGRLASLSPPVGSR